MVPAPGPARGGGAGPAVWTLPFAFLGAALASGSAAVGFGAFLAVLAWNVLVLGDLWGR